MNLRILVILSAIVAFNAFARAVAKPEVLPSPSDKQASVTKSSSDPWEKLMASGADLMAKRSYPEAEKTFDAASVLADKFLRTDVRVYKTLSQQLACLYAENKLAQAEPIYKKIIAYMEMHNGFDDEGVITALKNYSLLLQKLGKSHLADVVDNRVSSLSKSGAGEHSHIANLMGSAITDDDAAFLLANLEPDIWQLDAAKSHITDKTLQLLRRCNALERVDLTETRISDAGLANLKGKKTITMLILGSTAVTDAGLANLTGLDSLKYLGLYGTKVTDKGLALVSKIGTLKSINLEKCSVTPAGIQRFKDSLPGCKVINP